MNDTESERDYPEVNVTLFDTLIKYPNSELPIEIPSPTLLLPPPSTPVLLVDGSSSTGKNSMFSFAACVNNKTLVKV